MTRTEFEKYLGKDVTITLYDGAIYAGILHQTGEKAFADNPNLSVPLNFYFCIDENNEVVKNTVFRVSHIQKISCNEKLRMTNFEKIKQMSIDEMARSCMSFFDCPYGTPYVGCPMEKRFNGSCIDCTKHWLESEADSNDT
jgi:hypothetical protein|nr:hypothetical protein [Ruminococcus bromii]DAO82697.1 MAG TPA: Gem-associated protein [Caudoviricetes sp.]